MSQKSRALKKLRSAAKRARKHAEVLKGLRVKTGNTMRSLNSLDASVEKIDIGEIENE
jgi:ribosomal protein L30/L7E